MSSSYAVPDTDPARPLKEPDPVSPTSTLALPVLDSVMEARLRDRMDQVEKRLEREIESEAPFITEACRHLLAAGGKRFRPLLVLLAAEAGDADTEAVLTAACVVELTHLASLYHDDVMDEAALRRGADSANARWDNHVAILAGDWLFSKSSELTSHLGPEAVRIQAHTFTRLVEGQILETQAPQQGEDLLAHYLRVVAGKTGSLIATSARYGAMFAGCSPQVVAALTAYGEKVGIAFQLSDDILDVASDSAESGKTPGTDLREGVRTLPVLFALRSTDPADGRLLELLAGPLEDDPLHAEALGLLRKHPAMDEARGYVLTLAREATDALAVLDEGPVRDALVAFADVIATRTA
jgi:heptaprenyl diphosphate synthase